MRRVARLLILILVMLAAMSHNPVPAPAAGTWTSPLGRVTITTFDYTQYKYDPCASHTIVTGTITPDPLHPQWVVSAYLVDPEGLPDDFVPIEWPETQFSFPYKFCGKFSEAGNYSVIVRYHGFDNGGIPMGEVDGVEGTFTVTTLPLTSTTTLKARPRSPDFRDKVTFRARSTFNDGVNAQGRVQLQFQWDGQWKRLTTLNLDDDGAAKITYKWKLCNQLKFRAKTMAEFHGPPVSHSKAIHIAIDQAGACITADSPQKVRGVFGE
jgi:hypothetical protein